MLETSARLLRLLSLLQSRPEWSGPELAERLDVTTRTVRRDVDKLRGLDYPVEVDLGPAGGYRLGSGAALPPLLLDDEEAVAVAVSLRTATGSGVAGVGEVAVRALVKLERLLPARLRHRLAAVPVATVVTPARGPSVDPEVLTAVGGACRDQRVLETDYVARDGTPSRRRLEPVHLVTWGRRWYLVAWDRDRDDWRTLRVDRMRPRTAPDGLATGPRFVPREVPGGDPAAFVAARVADVRSFRCVVRVGAAAERVAATIWADQVRTEEIDADSCRVHLACDDVRAATIILAGLDAELVVESPPELVDEARRLAERWSRATGCQRGRSADTGCP